MIRFLASALLLNVMISIPASSAVSRLVDKTEGEPQYDPATVMHVTGTVIQVREAPANQPLGGIHLLIGTDTGEIETYLGPVDFLKEFEIRFSQGNAIEVVGSRVASGSGHVVLAREVRKGEVCLYLRDKSGRPNWPHRRGPAELWLVAVLLARRWPRNATATDHGTVSVHCLSVPLGCSAFVLSRST